MICKFGDRSDVTVRYSCCTFQTVAINLLVVVANYIILLLEVFSCNCPIHVLGLLLMLGGCSPLIASTSLS